MNANGDAGMSNREYEQTLERVLSQDFSDGTEAFRDELLNRCLAVLESDEHASVIPDEELEMLAAAGDIHQIVERP